MRKELAYKEPEFRVVLTSAQDVLTASGDTSDSPDPYESGMIHL